MKLFASAAAAACLLALATPAAAGIYSDDLSRCIVRSTDKSDLNALMTWFFGVLSVNPSLSNLPHMADADRDAAAKRTATLFQRLLVKDCRTQTVEALRYEGASALESSFQVLGEVGARSLASDPAVEKEIGKLATYIDVKALESLATEIKP